MQIPEWVVLEVGRLHLEALAAQQRISELEAQVALSAPPAEYPDIICQAARKTSRDAAAESLK